MKRILITIVIASAFASAFAFGNMKISKIHKGMNKNGKNINCAYCHTTNKIQKVKQDIKKVQKNSFCQGKGCHGK